MQQKMENFFIQKPLSPNNFSKTHKTCFIYDPVSFRAYFDYYSHELATTHEYIASCNVKTKIAACSATPNLECSPSPYIKIRLYYKKCIELEPAFPKINTNIEVPLLKSNLQKAIRRQNMQVAIQTAATLMMKDPIEFARRLSIIEIEDVCLFDHYPILVWLSMAGNHYKVKTRDYHILLCIVATLCKCPDYYEECYIGETVLRHEMIENMETGSTLLSLLYRIQYGGMPGDIHMLKCSLAYYTNTGAIQKTDWDSADDIIERIPLTYCEIIPEAIDFHPYPGILRYVGKHTSIPINIVKEVIWNGESCLNTRKPIILAKVKTTQESIMWKKIKPIMDTFRYTIICGVKISV